MEKIKYCFIMLLLPVVIVAAEPPLPMNPSYHSVFDRNVMYYHSGSFSEINIMGDEVYSVGGIRKKSPLLAGIMSAVVPGTGEIYAGTWWRGLIHLGIEVGSWAAYFHYDARGDDQTALFETYANSHWDVTRYVRWLNVYWGGSIYINPNQNLLPWERVDWQQINDFERTISQFSHRLEPFGTQQYYELIGKYPQYNRGWEDSHPIGNFEPGENQIRSEQDAYFDDISEMFSFYSSKRGYANTLYARAHNAVLVVFLNHVISAFHAAFLAHSFNQTHFGVDIENRKDLYGERFVPTVRLRIAF
jgi:hypothetical protein